jgi:hypothetical protein
MSDRNFYGFLAVQMALTAGLLCFSILWKGPWNSARLFGLSHTGDRNCFLLHR